MSQENGIVNGNQIFEALMAIARSAKNKKEDKGLDFRFLVKYDSKSHKEKEDLIEKVKEIEEKLEKEFGICVEFYEDIDVKDTSEGHKFYFRIYDMNNCFTEIDALDYRRIVLDPSKSVIDYIAEKLFLLLGLKVQEDVLKISEMITELISYVYYSDELQYKVYENIGWDIYNNELIFKYDRIYRKNINQIRSACLSDIAGKLNGVKTDREGEANWRDKFGKLMNSCTIARTVVSAACTGMVRSIIPYDKENNINMNIFGEPGTGKSSLSQFALSIFGNPQALEGSFIDKDNAMEIIRVKRPVIPYVLDDRLLKIDTLSDKAKGRELLFDVFREYEGKVTERIGGTHKELSGKRTNAPIISSSVDSMVQLLKTSGRDLGQYRRIIELKLTKDDRLFENNPHVVREYHDLAYQSYGIGVQYIADYILNVGVNFVRELYECVVNDVTDKLDSKSKELGIGNLSSSASRFALIATTYVIIREAINKINSEFTYDVEHIGCNQNLLEKLQEVELMSANEYSRNGLSTFEYINKLGKLDAQKSVCEYIVPNEDIYYDQLIEYLIDNLVEKVGKIHISLNVEKNLIKFLKNEANKKWFVETNKTDFFKNQKATHIGMIEKVGSNIKITFRGKKYIEWLLCSGKNLNEEEIKSFLEAVNSNNDPKSFAEKIFGKEIVNVDIEQEIAKYDNLSFCKENKTNSERNPVSITIKMTDVEE